MRHLATLIVAALAVGSFAADKVPKQWVKTYKYIAKVVQHKDVDAFMATCDKSFINLQNGQKANYDQYAKGFKQFIAPFSDIKIQLTPTAYREDGQNVLIDFEYRFEGIQKDKDGNPKKLAFFQVGTDTWHKVGKKYLTVQEEIKKQGLLPAKTA